MSKVYVIFKTHLDVGFTDFASNVVRRYFDEFIPQAMALSETLAREVPDAPFRWTLSSWLVYEYLEQATPRQRRQMENAIEKRYLRWHALPFTTHTEYMTADLFRAGLGISHELDRRFGTRTTAAKMTDVPGHTRAMVPLLAEAGVTFLHIGVNPAATVPDVPPVFVWRDEDSGADVICMYQQVYGDTMALPGTGDAMALVFTGDNQGPPVRESVIATFAELRKLFPQADLVGASLEDIAVILQPVREYLPVVTAEIGDTWIQGVGSDPTKTRQYLALVRWMREKKYDNEIDNDTLTRFARALLMIPEHTWGLDLKKHLADYEHYDTPALAKARHLPNFQKMEESWREQHGYIEKALATLPRNLDEVLRAEFRESSPQRPDLETYQRVQTTRFETPNWNVAIDPQTGAIVGLASVDGRLQLADPEHSLGLLCYQTFSTSDYDRYWQQYIRDREHGDVRVWAHPDNVKPGLQVEKGRMWLPQVHAIYHRDDHGPESGNSIDYSVLVQLVFPDEARAIGAPGECYLRYEFYAENDVVVTVDWFDKPACRLPEAFWVSFNPLVAQPERWRIRKLGRWISPVDVVSGGGRTLHGTDYGIRYEDGALSLNIASMDASLVAPGQPSLLDFHNRLPDVSQGMHVNLYNNVWGTNFRMWYEDDARFRFYINAERP